MTKILVQELAVRVLRGVRLLCTWLWSAGEGNKLTPRVIYSLTVDLG